MDRCTPAVPCGRPATPTGCTAPAPLLSGYNTCKTIQPKTSAHLLCLAEGLQRRQAAQHHAALASHIAKQR
eukprot:scaffold142742_cov18-Tisochrysis_lutea.AAC.2